MLANFISFAFLAAILDCQLRGLGQVKKIFGRPGERRIKPPYPPPPLLIHLTPNPGALNCTLRPLCRVFLYLERLFCFVPYFLYIFPCLPQRYLSHLSSFLLFLAAVIGYYCQFPIVFCTISLSKTKEINQAAKLTPCQLIVSPFF